MHLSTIQPCVQECVVLILKIFLIVHQDMYALVCVSDAHGKIQDAFSDSMGSGSERTLPKYSTKNGIKSIGFTINFIDMFLKSLK